MLRRAKTGWLKNTEVCDLLLHHRCASHNALLLEGGAAHGARSGLQKRALPQSVLPLVSERLARCGWIVVPVSHEGSLLTLGHSQHIWAAGVSSCADATTWRHSVPV